MKLRETIAWMLVAASLIVAIIKHNSNQESLRLIYECANDLVAGSDTVQEAAFYAEHHGDQILECTESICRSNGWTPPEGWLGWETKVP